MTTKITHKFLAFAIAATSLVHTSKLSAQTNVPDAMNFQAIARDASNNIVANTSIEVQMTVHNTSSTGPILSQLRFIRNTDAFGQFSLTMSVDSASGIGTAQTVAFNQIDWSTGDKYIQIEYKPSIASPYIDLGAIRANSTFYAFHARTAENITLSATNGQVLKYNSTSGKWVAGTDNNTTYTGSNTVNINGSNAISVAPNSIGATQLSITSLPPSGNAGGDLNGSTYPNPVLDNGVVTGVKLANNAVTSVKIQDGAITANDLNDMSANSGQVLKFNGSAWAPAADNNTTYTQSIGITISGTQISATDASVTNEAQTLSLNGNTISLSQANGAGGGNADLTSLFNLLSPPGTIVAFGGTTAPAGWLLCDGSAVSRTGTYANLYNAISIAYGTGNGTTTFNVPDFRGKFLRGVDGAAGNDPDATSRIATNGGNTGNNVGSVQADELASHRHSVRGASGAVGLSAAKGFLGGNNDEGSYIDSGSGAPFVGLSGGNETRPKNVYVNYIIKY